MVYLDVLPGGSHSIPRTWQHSLVCKVASEQTTRLWTDKTKGDMFGHNAQQHIWRIPNTTYQHSGRVVMIWTYFAVTGPGNLEVNESTMKSATLSKIGSCSRRKTPSTPANCEMKEL